MPPAEPSSPTPSTSRPPVLEVQDLRKLFPVSRGLLGALRRQPQRWVHAVDGISFALGEGEILAMVGESGCGKTTTALTLMGLEQPDGGTIRFRGEDVTHLGDNPPRARGTSMTSLNGHDTRREPSVFPMTIKRMRLQMQMVFQDPYESLNPRATVFETVAEPLVVHSLVANRREKLARVTQALADAGLNPPEVFLGRRPHELSGGQRQRVIIAGALVLEPALLIADEPVSMLDVSIRAEILNLLDSLRTERGISILCITHDLATAAFFTDRVAVMYLGRIVELGPTARILAEPLHPYTKALLSVIPVPNPRLRRQRTILRGETPNPIELPPGCRFQPRCPLAAEICERHDPRLLPVRPGHEVACLLVEGS
jgi:oligopeptide/dipeptide ABC transporter ATP-binding protein